MAGLKFTSFLALLTLLPSPFTNATPLRQTRQTQACTKATFSNASLPQGISILVERMEPVAQNANFTEGPQNIAWGPATNLPSLCAAIINVADTSVTPPSAYRFGMFLPDNWNSRILTIGSESFAGGINWPGMAEGVNYNMTTISTDNGHSSTGGNLSWGLHNDAQLLDWGFRAVHGSVEIGKILTKSYYNLDIQRSYYSGCSTGGRQGLKEIQISPDSFDGALIGAPAWDTKYLMPRITKIASDSLKVAASDRLDANGGATLITLQDYIYAACDSIDGVNDTIISMPEKCNIETVFAQSRCQNSAPSASCLTDAQIQLARSMYSDYVTSDGTFIQSSFLPSSEISWFTYVTTPDLTGFDSDYERYFLYNNTAWATTQFTDTVALNSIATNPGQATADAYDITPYQSRGGKILMYHGMADGIVPTRSSEYYYNKTQAAMPSVQMDSFFRYFQIPGMGHCWNGAGDSTYAPWMIGGYGQANLIKSYFPDGWSVPGHQNDPKYDALAALMEWTEGGDGVEEIVATNWQQDHVTVYRQRPICKWPNFAELTPGMNVDNATSWTCVAPK